MASFNKVLLMGNLTRDPELRYTPGGQAVCDLGIAVNRRYSVNGQEREEVCFVDIVVWAKQAESCGRYLHKGSPVFVEGRLQYDSWDDKDGKKRSRLRVTAERVQFLGARNEEARQGGGRSDGYNNYQNDGNRFGGRPSYQNQSQYSQNTSRGYNQNQRANYNEPMPPPPPEVFDSEIEPEDDIPF